jgi:pimeloyl-ACP methyl ester carboxylesterase
LPFAEIIASPLLPDVSPVKIWYRDTGRGSGPPLLFLHGGWGYESYPFERQLEVFGDYLRMLIPDRSGYGRSMQVSVDLPVDFHARAAVEMISFLDALNVERAVLWGHSDGAVIAAMMGLLAPERFFGLILEAFHYFKRKSRSREFFESITSNPDCLREKVRDTLALDHGEDCWRKVVQNNGCAWLEIASESKHPEEDLYGGKLGTLTVPTIFIHGSDDPRTEPGELLAVKKHFPQAAIQIMGGARHSPHSERSAFRECNRLAKSFLQLIIATSCQAGLVLSHGR